MNKENTDVSRRAFLSKGAAVAAGATIIAVPAFAATEPEAVGLTNLMRRTNDPVYTDDVQTLTNKTISSWQNKLGTDAINVREFLSSGTDITSALNSAISYLVNAGVGGQILIPHGVWTTNGGHDLNQGMTIEGVGPSVNGYNSTEIKLNASQSSFVFRIKTGNSNITVKNLMINLVNNSSATGLLLTDHQNGTSFGPLSLYSTHVTNVYFKDGAYGIKVDSKEVSGVSTNFECILNRFEKVLFIGCQTSFYCNSVNGGYEFDTCYFSLPTSAGTALECKFMGFMSLHNCLFVGVSTPTAHVPPSDGTTILKTVGAYGSISFYDCQDENVQYYYQNSTNDYDYVPIVFRNCLIQATFKYTANGSVIFDACRINVTDIGYGHVKVKDTSTKFVRVILKNMTNLFWHTGSNTRLDDFVNPYSQMIYDSNDAGAAVITPVTDTSSYYIINASRGTVNVQSGTSYIQVYNRIVSANSLIFTQLLTYDSGGARIRNVVPAGEYFVIYLTQNAATNLNIAFKVENWAY